MKKVLFLIHTLQAGGAEKVLVDLVNALDKNKFDITVMTVCDFGDLKYQLNKNIKYRSIFKFKFLKKITGNKKYGQTINTSTKKNLLKEFLINCYKSFWRIANLDKFYRKHIKEEYDIEVAFLEGIPAKIISHSSNPKSKKVVWLHVDLINENKSECFFTSVDEQKQVYSAFDEIVCVSGVVKESFCKKYDFDGNRVKVIYNPINEKTIQKKSVEEITDLTKTNFTFCTVGRLAKQKGYDRLLRAVKRLNDDNLACDIWIIGVGVLEGELKKQKEKLGLSNVYFLGYKNNPYPYIKNADAFVCSSHAEGFSTSVSEAVVLGKPVVTTDCSGMREILGNNSEYGLICKNDEESLYMGLRSMMDGVIYDDYCCKVAERKSMFNYERSVSEIENFLMELVNEK